MKSTQPEENSFDGYFDDVTSYRNWTRLLSRITTLEKVGPDEARERIREGVARHEIWQNEDSGTFCLELRVTTPPLQFPGLPNEPWDDTGEDNPKWNAGS